MADFEPLRPRLKQYWSTPFDELPDDLKEAVSKVYHFSSWDLLSSEWRQKRADESDYEKTPANRAAIELDFNLRSQIGDLERERRDLELMRATSPLERESQVRQFAEIDAQIAAIEKQLLAPTAINETSKQRNARLLARRKELRVAGVHNPTKTLAQEFGISDSLVRRILRNTKPTKKPKSTAIASLLPRRK